MTPTARFNNVLLASECPFAAKAKLVSSPHANTGTSAAAIADLEHLQILSYLERIVPEQIDGFVIEIANEGFACDLDTLAKSVADLLDSICLRLNGHRIKKSEVLTHRWWLRLGEVRHFVLVFSPHYSRVNPRSTLGDRSTYILLQPVTTFERHAIDGNAIDYQTRFHIWRRFIKSERPYSRTIADDPREAVKFILPPTSCDNPIAWWQWLPE